MNIRARLKYGHSCAVFAGILASTVISSCNGATFASSPGVVMTYLGDSATFSWRVDDSVDVNISVVEFSYTGIPSSYKLIYQKIPYNAPTWYNGYVPDRVSVTYSPDNHGLGFTLSQIQTSDTGHNLSYSCRVTYLGDQMNDDNADLLIYGQPSVPTITPNPPNAVEGGSYSLTCSAVTSSLPAGLAPGMTYTWTRDGAPLPTDRHSVDGGELIISPVQRQDHQRVYRCQAREKNSTLSNSKNIQIDVKSGPVSISLNNEGPITVEEGDHVTATCKSDCSPSCSYTWSRSGDSGWSQDSATLSFPDIDRADHNTYTCIADNGYGSKSASVVINVNFGSEITSFSSSPTNIFHGDGVILSCSVSSRPNSDVTISSENTEPVSGTKSTVVLEFTPVSILDSGSYRCTAYNDINTNLAIADETLDVKGGFQPCEDQKDSVVRGEPLSVGFTEYICQFANPFHPISRTNWTFQTLNDTRVNHGLPDDVIVYMRDSDHMYTKTIIVNISSVTSGHYGTYSFYSGNEYGSLEFTLRLIPKGPPVPPSDLVCTKITAVSVYLQWVAGYHGGSDQTFVVVYTDTHTGQFYTKLVDGSDVPQGGNVSHKLSENDGITPSTTYRIQVDAQNADGHYTPGPSVINTTLARPEFINKPSISIMGQTALIICEISNIESVSHLNIDACDTENSTHCDNASFTDLTTQLLEMSVPQAEGFHFTFLFYDGTDLVHREEYTYASGGRPSIGLIAGVTLAVVAAAAIVLGVVILWRKGAFSKRQSHESRRDAHYENADAINLNTVKLDVQYEDVSLTAVVRVEDKTYEGLVGENVSKVPGVYETFKGKHVSVAQYRPSDIRPGDMISRGAVFCVQAAVLLRGTHNEKVRNAIIKKTACVDTDLYKRYLTEAAQVMSGMESCPYLVHSPGVVADSLLMEKAPLGNLREYLRGMADHAYANTADVIQTEWLGFIRDAFEGFKAIQSLKPSTLFYCLSTDHVLLGQGQICKLTGFNTAEYVCQREQWEQYHDLIRPLRWLAPEAIDLRHVPESDIWAFGVLVWEIFNYGLQPYPDTEDSRVVDLVKRGHRQLEMPPMTPPTLCDLVSTCWMITAELRQNIDRINKVIKELESQ